MTEKVKNIIIITVAIIICLVALLFGGSKTKRNENTLSENVETIVENAQKESGQIKDEEQLQLSEINMDTYLEYYNGEENKIVLLARPTCHYCQIAEPIIKKIAKDNNLEISYLNTDNFNEDDQEKLIHSDEFFKEGYGTPVLLIVGQGKIVNRVDGLTDTAHYVEFFKENNFIS